MADFAGGRIQAFMGPTELGAADDLETIIVGFVGEARESLDAGFIWHVRDDFAGKWVEPPGPIRQDVEYWPPINDSGPHRFICRSQKCRKSGGPGGSVWHIRELPTGAPGSEMVLT